MERAVAATVDMLEGRRLLTSVTAINFNDEANQQTITVSFSDPINASTVSPEDLIVRKVGTDTRIAPEKFLPSFNSAHTQVTFRYADLQLGDGNYTVQINKSDILTAADSDPLDNDASASFFFVLGDYSGPTGARDRQVDQSDVDFVTSQIGTVPATYGDGDIDGDGVVTSDDADSLPVGNRLNPPAFGVSDLTAQRVGANGTLQWTRATSSSTSFRVQRSADGGHNFTTIASSIAVVSGQSTYSYTDTSVPATSVGYYVYRVRSIGGPLVNGAAVPAAYTFVELSDSSEPASSSIQEPGEVRLSLSKNTAVVLWDDTNQTEVGYDVLRLNPATGGFDIVAQLPPNTTSWTDVDRKANTEYRYKVRARGSTASATSGVVVGNTLSGAPSVLTAGDLDAASPQHLIAVFDQPIYSNVGTLNSSHVTIRNLDTGYVFVGGGSTPDYTVSGISGQTIRAEIGGHLNPELPGVDGILPNGNYSITVNASAVKNAANEELTDVEQTAKTFFMRGDFNHDRKITFDDLVILAQNYNLTGRTHATGDADFDGTVGFNDLVLLGQRYQSTYPEPLVGPSALQASTGKLPFSPTDASISPSHAAFVEWTPPTGSLAGFVGYKIWRSLDGTNFTAVATVPLSQLSYVDKGLSEGTRYTYQVRPYDSSGNYGQVTNKAAVVTTLPAPRGVIVEPAGSDRLRVSWFDQSSNESGFELQILDENENVVATKNVAANTTSVEVDGLAEGAQYLVRLSSKSESAVGRTADVTARTRQGAPTNVAFTSTSGTSADVSWTDSSGSETGYTIQWIANASYVNGSGQTVPAGALIGSMHVDAVSGIGSTRSVSVTGLPTGVDLFFNVTTEQADASGGPSSSVPTGTTQGSPATGRSISSVTVEPLLYGNTIIGDPLLFGRSSDQIKIKWTDNQRSVVHYYVWMETPARSLVAVVPVESGSSGNYSYVAHGLDPRQEYSFSVQPEVVDASQVQTSTPSSIATGLQYAGQQVGVWATDIDNRKVTIHWNPLENGDAAITLYQIDLQTNDVKEIGTFGESSNKCTVDALRGGRRYRFYVRVVYHHDRYADNSVDVTTDKDDDHGGRPQEPGMLSGNQLGPDGLPNYDVLGSNYIHEVNAGVGWYFASGIPEHTVVEQNGDDLPYMKASKSVTHVIDRVRYHDEYYDKVVFDYAGGQGPAAFDIGPVDDGDPRIDDVEPRYKFQSHYDAAFDSYTVSAKAFVPDWSWPQQGVNTVAIESGTSRIAGSPSSIDWSAVGEGMSYVYGADSWATVNVAPGDTIRVTYQAYTKNITTIETPSTFNGSWTDRAVVRSFTAPDYHINGGNGLQAEDDADGDDQGDDDNSNDIDHSPRPTNVEVVESTDTTNRVRLKDNAKNEDGVEVERTRDGAHWSLVWQGARNSSDSRTIEFVDGGLSPGVEYEYRARAFKWSKTDQPLDDSQPLSDSNVLHALEFTGWSKSTDESKGLTDAQIGVWAETPKAQEGQSTAAKFGLYALGEFKVADLPGHGYTVNLQVPSNASASYFSDYTFAQGTGLPTAPPAPSVVNFSLLQEHQLQTLDVNIGGSEGEVEGDEQLVLKVMPQASGDRAYVPATLPDATITIKDGYAVTDVRWEPINTPTISSGLDLNDQNPHLNGGLRIFPDKQNPADTIIHDLVDVVATVSPTPPVGTIVYFQSYDVDDPNDFVVGEPAAEQIDKNDTATIKKGLDNRGTTPGQRGTFFPPTIIYRASAPTDASGVARAQFQVTRQPGDNFRVAAAMAGPELDKISDDSVPPNSLQISGYVGRLSDMLTVWRHLWIERDSMTGVTAHTVVVTLTGVATVAQPGTGGANDVINATATGEVEDEFEGGTLAIPGIGTFAVRKNRDGGGSSTINVPAGSIPAGTAFPIPGAILTDDDVIPGTGTLPLPSGGPLADSAFGDAYIIPKYVDAGPGSLNVRGTIPFVRHVNDTWPATARDLPASTSDYWTMYLIGGFEDFEETDGDPDGIAPAGLGIPSPVTDSKFDFGLTEGAYSLIFLETIDDFVRQGSSFTDQWHTVVHEIGHSANGAGHTSSGIMRAGAPSGQTVFDNYYLDIFRSLDKWGA